jgi:hypothetical protein
VQAKVHEGKIKRKKIVIIRESVAEVLIVEIVAELIKF